MTAPVMVSLRASLGEVDEAKGTLFIYPTRSPIGAVDLGPLSVNFYSVTQARQIAAEFTRLAAEFQAYEDSHCPECFAETPAGDPSPTHGDTCSRGGAA